MGGWMGAWEVGGWMSGRVDGCVSGWMSGRVGGWVDGCMINRKEEKKEVMYLQVPVFFCLDYHPPKEDNGPLLAADFLLWAEHLFSKL